MINDYFESADEIIKRLENKKGKDSDLVDLKNVIESLGYEANYLKGEEKKKTKDKIATYKTKYETFQRESLLGSGGDKDDGIDMKDRERLINSTMKAQKGVSSLEESRRILSETEEVAGGILEELNKQKETIQRSQAKLKEIDDSTHTANRILNKMGKWWA